MVKTPTEYHEQTALAAWLDRHIGPYAWLHVANESPRSRIHGARLKRAGLKPGAPDILIFMPPPLRPDVLGVAIELKRRTGTKADVRRNQRAWLEALQKFGWITHVAFGAYDAGVFLKNLGYGSKRR